MTFKRERRDKAMLRQRSFCLLVGFSSLMACAAPDPVRAGLIVTNVLATGQLQETLAVSDNGVTTSTIVPGTAPINAAAVTFPFATSTTLSANTLSLPLPTQLSLSQTVSAQFTALSTGGGPTEGFTVRAGSSASVGASWSNAAATVHPDIVSSFGETIDFAAGGHHNFQLDVTRVQTGFGSNLAFPTIQSTALLDLTAGGTTILPLAFQDTGTRTASFDPTHTYRLLVQLTLDTRAASTPVTAAQVFGITPGFPAAAILTTTDTHTDAVAVFDAAAVPEPESLVLFVSGLVVFVGLHRRTSRDWQCPHP
jgi:hypothetical protein